MTARAKRRVTAACRKLRGSTQESHPRGRPPIMRPDEQRRVWPVAQPFGKVSRLSELLEFAATHHGIPSDKAGRTRKIAEGKFSLTQDRTVYYCAKLRHPVFIWRTENFGFGVSDVSLTIRVKVRVYIASLACLGEAHWKSRPSSEYHVTAKDHAIRARNFASATSRVSAIAPTSLGN